MSASEEDLFNLDDLEEINFPPEVQKAIDQVITRFTYFQEPNHEKIFFFRCFQAKIPLINLILIQ